MPYFGDQKLVSWTNAVVAADMVDELLAFGNVFEI